jgi:hypothetical protein
VEEAQPVIPAPKLGWMAGIVDLKGRLIYKANRSRATPQVVLMVETREYPIIKTLGVLTGTKAEFKKAQPLKEFMRRGCSDHCPDAHVHVSDDREMPQTARWTITGAGMVVILTNLMPYLTIDRGYTEAIEQVQGATALEGQGSGTVMMSLQRLQSLDWELPDKYTEALRRHLGEERGDE